MYLTQASAGSVAGDGRLASPSPGDITAVPPAARIAVVIPCYRVTRTILGVLARIGPDCWRIYVIDDACPDGSGELVERQCRDPRVRVIRLPVNQGVGGAVMSGYRRAVADGASVVVKLDGDGQMAPELLPAFVAPILAGDADYAKGNRFYNLERITAMPKARIFGNAVLSILAKLSTGYWTLFDPTNGYTALHASLIPHLPLSKISSRYFFETDILFRLNTLRAVVVDVPIDAVYGEEVSNLRISEVLWEFLAKHVRNFAKRIFYNYFLRDVSLASLELLFGTILLVFGLAYGSYHWWQSFLAAVATPAGTVMLASVAVLVGLQLILSFLSYDIAAAPKRPIHNSLSIQFGSAMREQTSD